MRKTTAKNLKLPFRPLFQNMEDRIQLTEQLQDKDSSDYFRAPYQPKSLVCIEVTTHRAHPNQKGDKILCRKVFYQKPLLTPQGKLDTRRLALGILLQLSLDHAK